MPQDFTIQDIMHGDSAQLSALFETAAAPATATTLRTTTADRFFKHLYKDAGLDVALLPALSQLQAAAINVISQQDHFYGDANHPLRLLLQCVVERARFWYPRDSKPNHTFFERLSALLETAIQWCATSATDETQTAELRRAISDFEHWSDSENKRAAMLEMRLVETEINHLKLLDAECSVLDLINSAFTGTELAIDLATAIPALKTELQHTLVTAHPTDSEPAFWKLWQRLLPLLGKIFSCNSDDEQQLYRDIPIALNELERSMDTQAASTDQYRGFVDTLSQVLMRRIQKQPQEYQLFAALPYPDDYHALQRPAVGTLLEQTPAVARTTIEQGEWIVFSGEQGELIRCKLALKNSDADQLLFVDNTGRKVMLKSSHDFSLCLSAGIATVLPVVSIPDTITRLLHALIELGQQKSAQLHAKRETEKARALAAAELQRQTELRQQAEQAAQRERELAELAAARRAAAHKALAEARTLADEKAKRTAAEALAQEEIRKREYAQQELEKSQRQQMAAELIAALNVGAWIDISDAQQASLRCKLAVIISAAGKYIFVDNLGRKIAEYQRAQLIEAYIDNRLRLINNGDRFEDQLVKVIRGLRRDIS